MDGYIKISRRILTHPALTKRGQTYCEITAWLWMCLEASFVDRDFQIGSNTIKLKRGELCHSVSYMATAWNWKNGRVQGFLNKLIRFNCISVSRPIGQSAEAPNVLKLLNYDEYQDGLVKSNVSQVIKKHKEIINKEDKYSSEFESLWNSLLLKKGSKKNAYLKWKKIKVDNVLLAKKYNELVKKTKDPQFVPHFITWLNGERYNDEDSQVEKKLSPDEYFRQTYNVVPKGFVMVANDWKTIEYTNGKERFIYSLKNGKKL